MSIRPVLQCALLMLAACAPGAADPRDPSAAGAIAARDWHAGKRRVDQAVDQALEARGGADYPKAIAILRASGRPAGTIDLEVGQLVTAAYRDTAVARMPAETLDDGVALLERAATGAGDAAGVAPQWLRLLFERGLAKDGRSMLDPDAALAACWRAVEKAAAGATAGRCVAERRQKRG